MSEIISVPGKCVGDDSYANGWNKCREAYLPLLAGRDARIVELESRYQRDVYGLNNEGDPIGGDPAGGYANDNARLRKALFRASLLRRVCTMKGIFVSVELLKTLLAGHLAIGHKAAKQELRALLSAPSPAGVDGLEVVAYRKPYMSSTDFMPHEPWCNDGISSEWEPLCRLSDAQAIIDGLRGEVAEQEEAANQWRELALQFDRHRMTAMAHIRAAASGDKSAIEALGVFAALPPIPGHEITAAHERQAQRIGELETALEFACKSLAQVTSSDGSGHADIAVSVLRMAGTKDADALHVVEAYKAGAKWRIDAALSAGKDGE